MPQPWNLITAYPTTEIDEYLKDKHDAVHVYVDLKNVLTGLWVQDVCEELILNTENYGAVDSSIFQAVINYASYWKRWANLRNKTCKVFVCTDTGKSLYHKKIYKMYKHRREVSDVQGAGFTSGIMDEKVKVIRDKNFAISENAVNKIPNVYFFNLKFLEADFLLHYLRYHKVNDPKALHVFISSDKDMYQSIVGSDTIMMYKQRGVKHLYDQHTTLGKYCDLKKASVNIQRKRGEYIRNMDPGYIAAIMACVGDDGDDVPGVEGVGAPGAVDIFAEQATIKMVGTPQELDDRIYNGGKFFLEDVVPLKHMSKKLQKCFLKNDIVTQAYKLISYSQLIRWLEKPDMTEKNDWRRYIDRILEKDGIPILPSGNALMAGLNKLNDNYLTEEVVMPLFN